MKLNITIELNDATMSTQGQVREVLAKLQRRLSYYGTDDSALASGTSDTLSDANLMPVGRWEVGDGLMVNSDRMAEWREMIPAALDDTDETRAYVLGRVNMVVAGEMA